MQTRQSTVCGLNTPGGLAIAPTTRTKSRTRTKQNAWSLSTIPTQMLPFLMRYCIPSCVPVLFRSSMGRVGLASIPSSWIFSSPKIARFPPRRAALAKALPMRSGSIEDIVARLTLWGRRAPKGLARVEFDSEFARKRVVNGLRLALAEAGILFHEIELPVRTPTSRVVRGLVERLTALASGVISISGFATAFPDDIPLEDSLRIFNFNRENLARPAVCQIWWMPTSFAEQFIRAV